MLVKLSVDAPPPRDFGTVVLFTTDEGQLFTVEGRRAQDILDALAAEGSLTVQAEGWQLL